MELMGLAEEYRTSAGRLLERIERLRAVVPEASWDRDPLVEKRIQLLERECCSLLSTACYLESYYQRERMGWRRR